ncbi:DEAD/DEAH box helicase family protein [Cupriavidus numazuensis]|uniref:Uncharacterized protein n=1 Tax=Cupriavidus numazuensis TaxID=221992 RepID=A0ABM8T9J0_9BURK|nr:hypothetical protein [Cupriavidus numazuensis]CAG2129307.1 hypothetical protein LMG26411_00153 [Cupriavidus numazuensis]
MLIGLTGRPGAGHNVVADYLARAHAFTPTHLITDELVDQLSDHHVVVTEIRDHVDADILTARGGILVHLCDPCLPDFGPANGIVLRDIDHQVTVTVDYFRAFDVLDRVIGEAEFCGAPA